MIKNLRFKILEKVFKEDQEKWETFEKYYPIWMNFLTTISSFIVLLWLFNRIYDRIGFDKTIMILMISGIIYLKSWLKLVAQKNEQFR